jgi:DNA-binding HxlR family transcriptional regulator
VRGTFRSGSCVLALLSELAGGDRSYEELKAALDGIAHGRLSDAFKDTNQRGRDLVGWL